MIHTRCHHHFAPTILFILQFFLLLNQLVSNQITYLRFIPVELILLGTEAASADHQVPYTSFECFPFFSRVEELEGEFLHLEWVQVTKHADNSLLQEPKHEIFVIREIVRLPVNGDWRSNLLLVNYNY